MAIPFAVHLTRGAAAVDLLAAPARRQGAVMLELDLAGVGEQSELERKLIEVFKIPYPSKGLQSIIDFGSSLDEWMDAPAGYCFVVRGVDDAEDDVVEALAGILPFMIDRWRSVGSAYCAILDCAAKRGSILDRLGIANRELRRFGESPGRVAPSGPVPVYVDGLLDQDVSAGAS